MPLSDDQRAMLQLVLQHGQSYEDIGSLQGLEVEQVRTRAREALTEIGGEDPDREVGLTDYLLGQADPIGRADVARQLQSDAGTRALAERLVAQLRLLAPGAELPDVPGDGAAPSPRRRPAPEPAAPSGERSKASVSRSEPPGAGGGRRSLSALLPRNRVQAIAGLAGAAL